MKFWVARMSKRVGENHISTPIWVQNNLFIFSDLRSKAATTLAKCQVARNSTSFHMILLGIMKFDLFSTSEWKRIVSPLGPAHSAPNPTLVIILLQANLVVIETGLFPSLIEDNTFIKFDLTMKTIINKICFLS